MKAKHGIKTRESDQISAGHDQARRNDSIHKQTRSYRRQLTTLETLQILGSLGLHVKLSGRKGSFDRNYRIFHGGSGNFAPYYKACREFILRDTQLQQLVLVPNTGNEQGAVLEQNGRKVVFSRRNDETFSTSHRLYAMCKELE